jgi:lipoprotein-releasing system permease protein
MALIALMSISVISLVVWLIVLFLSVTEGIEKTWLHKLTSFNAPLRLTPTQNYYSSYYYLSDSISCDSHYTARSLKEKLASSDLYNPEMDETVPSYWPKPERNGDGSLRDPLKLAHEILLDLKKENSDLAFQDFEMSGAMLKLQLVRPIQGGGETHSFLTQASYLASFADQSPHMKELISPPSIQDLNHLFFLCHYSPEIQTQELGYNPASFKKKVEELLSKVEIKTLKTTRTPWQIPRNILPENIPLSAGASFKGKELARFFLGSSENKGTLLRQGDKLFWNNQEVSLPVYASQEIAFDAKFIPGSLQIAQQLSDLHFNVKGALEGIPLQGEINWNGVEIVDANIQTDFQELPAASPFWVHGINEKLVLPTFSSKERGILLSRQFHDTGGIRIGDRGWLSYPAATTGALQEQRLPIFVAGFYDPGVLAIGNKCVLAPANIVHFINTTSQVEHFDKTQSAGFAIWTKEIKNAPHLAKKIEQELKNARIDQYWKVTTYKDYDFAKDLLQQFQSDRYLFTLIGLVILLVACSNIISFLVILVNDKKQEIGILQALGASRKSIAMIFGGLGAALGILSSFVGVAAALLTLKNLDKLVQFLSFLQGHDAFNAVFYGSSLPSELSFNSLLFVLIMTPILSLLAGLIPAWKACRLSPSAILRSE